MNQTASRLSPTVAVILMLALLTGLGQFASNVYLPALPAVSQSLAADMTQVQWTLAIFLAALAISQLLFGPLSDRFGRRLPLLSGLVLYVLASAGAALAQDITTLMVARVLQGLGAGAALVVARAMTRDSFEGADLARISALIMIVFGMVPGLSPLLGGVLTDLSGWPSVFWMCGLLGVVAIAGSLRLPETNQAPLATLAARQVVADYRGVLAIGPFRRFAIPAALVIGSLSAFFAGSPAVLIDHLGISATEFGFYPPIAILGFFIGGMLARRFAGGRSPWQLASAGLLIMLAGTGVMVLPLLFGFVHKYQIAGAMVVHVSGLGLAMPTLMAAALSSISRNVGVASAVLGFSQMAIGALSTVLVSLLQPLLPVLAFPLVMLLFTGAAVVTLGRAPASAAVNVGEAGHVR